MSQEYIKNVEERAEYSRWTRANVSENIGISAVKTPIKDCNVCGKVTLEPTYVQKNAIHPGYSGNLCPPCNETRMFVEKPEVKH